MRECNLHLEQFELMHVIDYFDEAGDGRISLGDVGRVLKAAALKREEAQHKKHDKKTKEGGL
jgi:Ca2+-binding EF-hand superfamily protein